MKKLFLLLLTAAVLLGMTACAPNQSGSAAADSTPPTSAAADGTDTPTDAVLVDGTFVSDSRICGLTVGGMNPEEALAALKKAAEGYRLDLTVNDEKLTISGQQIELQVDEEQFNLFCEAAASSASFEGQLLRCSKNQLYLLLSDQLEVPMKNAAITYDEANNQFVAEPARAGKVYAMNELTTQVSRIACDLAQTGSVNVPCNEIQPAVGETDPEFRTALETANEYLDISLSYTFTPDGGETQTEKLEGKTIADLISVSDDLEVNVDEKQVLAYATSLGEKYHVLDYKGDFITSNGTTIGYTVDYYGQQVDCQALAEDLLNCIRNGQSGTRTAPYLSKTGKENMPYGGSYVEVNLNAQRIWVYENGECVVTSSIVSGSPAYKNCTPTGVYTIYDHDRNCYLGGADYETFVSYWMAFYGPYGLHDASWRSYFGGDIYLYEGSHGCVNLPWDVAPQVFAHTQVGTKVILYGGATTVDPVTQQILGTKHYDVAEDDAPFALNAQLLYDQTDLRYTSDNPKVATVSKDGVVTVKGVGTTTITVKAEQYYFLTEASMTVTVTVHTACEEGRHSYGPWKQTIAPTCRPGVEEQTCGKCGDTRTRDVAAVADHTPGTWEVTTAPGCETAGILGTACTVCGQRMEEQIPAIGHDFREHQPACGNGCGAANPNYVPPETDETIPETDGNE